MAEIDQIVVPYYLYKIINNLNGKIYIGVTSDPDKRKKQHLHYKRANPKTLIKRAVNKYGSNNFTFEVICSGSREYIYDLEVKAIELYESAKSGYNLKPGGVGGKGCSVPSRKDDKPVFAAGFWFPNKRTVLGKLGISLNVYEARRQSGNLVNTQIAPRKTNSTALAVPNYFKGFWFPDLFIASEIFNIRPETIRQRILRGYVEEKGIKSSKKVIRKYSVLGKSFNTLQEASELFGIPYTTIKNRISKGVPSYGYIYEIQEQ